jgi:hypothetical protein
MVSMGVPDGSKATVEPGERRVGEFDTETSGSVPPLSIQSNPEVSPNENHPQAHREPNIAEHGESQGKLVAWSFFLAIAYGPETLLLLDGPEAEGNATSLCKGFSGENGSRAERFLSSSLGFGTYIIGRHA